MARTARKDRKSVDRAKLLAKRAKSIAQLRQALSIILPDLQLSISETADMLGISISMVSELRSKFFSGEEIGEREKRGGRREENVRYAGVKGMSVWIARVKRGEKTPQQMQAWLKGKLKRPIPLSSVYMILHRQGWSRSLAIERRRAQVTQEGQQD